MAEDVLAEVVRSSPAVIVSGGPVAVVVVTVVGGREIERRGDLDGGEDEGSRPTWLGLLDLYVG